MSQTTLATTMFVLLAAFAGMAAAQSAPPQTAAHAQRLPLDLCQ